jgi:hypothetical protein
LKWLHVLIGFAVGTTFSVVIWLPVWRGGTKLFSGYGAAVAIGTKLLVAIVLVSLPRWRGIGLGLLLSIGFIALVFASLCFAVLRG